MRIQRLVLFHSVFGTEAVKNIEVKKQHLISLALCVLLGIIWRMAR
jgi:hypothetical protein